MGSRSEQSPARIRQSTFLAIVNFSKIRATQGSSSVSSTFRGLSARFYPHKSPISACPGTPILPRSTGTSLKLKIHQLKITINMRTATLLLIMILLAWVDGITTQITGKSYDVPVGSVFTTIVVIYMFIAMAQDIKELLR